MKWRPILVSTLCTLLGALSCTWAETTEPQLFQYQILDTQPHDAETFTQGFEIHAGRFYESSGLYEKSHVLHYPTNGNQNKVISPLASDHFAEGLTVFDNKVFLLTWKAGKAFVLNSDSLKRLKSFNYEGEGWGLTHNDTHLIMSDGSANLYWRSPKTFAIEKTLQAHSKDKIWERLNELEYVDGVIWANQWQENVVLGIDESSGQVLYTVDITPLQQQAALSVQSVANGIAYDAEREAFWITGKYWRYRYLLKFTAAN